MNQYTPPPESSRPQLSGKPWSFAELWQKQLPQLWAGQTTTEHVIEEIKKGLLEKWPGQRVERAHQAQARAEQQRELAEMKENETRTEPVFVRLPAKATTTAAAAAGSTESSDAPTPKPAPADSGSGSTGSEIEPDFESEPAPPAGLAKPAETDRLEQSFEEDEWEGTQPAAEYDFD